MTDFSEIPPAAVSLPVVPAVPQWSPDIIFPMLADPVRRRLLLRLAAGTPLAASQLAPGAGRRLDAVLKHLSALRSANLVMIWPDPVDKRRQLYSLSPLLTVTTTMNGRELDFGCCVVRL